MPHGTSFVTRVTPMEEATIYSGGFFKVLHAEGWLVARALSAGRDWIHKDDYRWPAITGGQSDSPLAATDNDNAAPSTNTFPGEPFLANVAAGGVSQANEGAGRNWQYHEKKNLMLQGFVEIDAPLTHVWMDVPLGSGRGGDIENAVGPANLTRAGVIPSWGWYWAGWESFMGKPTAASMYMVPYQLKMGWAISNLQSFAVTPRLIHHMNKVWFEALNVKDDADRKLIEDILKDRIPNVSWAPLSNGFKYQPGFRSTYGVAPVTLTKDGEAMESRGMVTSPGG